MTTSTRRSVLRTTAWSSLAIAAALAGCSKKEDTPAAALGAEPVAKPRRRRAGVRPPRPR
jgi:hypothetical protein